MGSGDPAADPLLPPLLRHHPGALSLSRRVAMARDATAAAVPALRPAWLLDLLPLLVVVLIAAHVLALVRPPSPTYTSLPPPPLATVRFEE
ncbi:hypothetical protein C2845_PM01G39610 [Panicum miliaceum]|uniref:Uncharacterized protein n=1 Tax=Panicum miliaceum TaxID=4540 RepID=A0A3L6TU85_PANMI|nr:hypothetical protein C2845_PM01G39610 [Panicum miliaceum]